MERSAPCSVGVVSDRSIGWARQGSARQGSLLPHGRERDDMLKKASQADTAVAFGRLGQLTGIAVAEVSIEAGASSAIIGVPTRCTLPTQPQRCFRFAIERRDSNLLESHVGGGPCELSRLPGRTAASRQALISTALTMRPRPSFATAHVDALMGLKKPLLLIRTARQQPGSRGLSCDYKART